MKEIYTYDNYTDLTIKNYGMYNQDSKGSIEHTDVSMTGFRLKNGII